MPAAPRRAWALVSVPISGLPLSWPVPVKGLVSRYLTNSLIGRSPILRHTHKHGVLTFRRDTIPGIHAYRGLTPVSRGCLRPEGRLATCY